jgi:hypothetical protein
MLELGRYASISEIAAAEKIDRGYVGSILRLTLLAPDIVEAILNGGQPRHTRAARLVEAIPDRIGWPARRSALDAMEEPQYKGAIARRHQLPV